MKANAAPQEPKKEPPLPPEKRLGYAVVGLGAFATQQIIPSFAECRSSKLTALVSGDRAKAEKYASDYGVNPKNIYDYKTMTNLRDNPDVDIIYIITPNSLHMEQTLAGFQAGKHVLCEKPMATSVRDCEKMIEAGKKANRKLMIAYRSQYEPFNLAVIDKVRKGEVGKLKNIVADHGRILNPAEKRDQWRAKKSLAGGGSLMDIGIYSLQAARYVTGEEPIEIMATQFSTPDDPRFAEVEETVHFILRFPSGVLANCMSSYGMEEVKRYSVFGSEGFLHLDPATDYYKHRLIVGKKGKTEEPQIKEGNQFAAMMDHFAECVRDNKTPKTPGEEGMQDVRLMMAIYESARTGRPIKMK